MWYAFLQSNRYKLLLITLMLCFIIVPTIFEVANLYETQFGSWFVFVISTVLLIIATFAVTGNRRARHTGVMLLMVSMLIEGASVLFVSSKEVAAIHHSLRAVFFGYIIVEILRSLFKPNVVTMDTISASLCVYIMLGALWAHFYSISEIMVPGSVAVLERMIGAVHIKNNDMTTSFRMLYFSLVTLSTVGYGDVVPLSPVTRMLAVSEAIIGQLYLLVMVSRLVGIHVAQALTPPQNK